MYLHPFEDVIPHQAQPCKSNTVSVPVGLILHRSISFSSADFVPFCLSRKKTKKPQKNLPKTSFPGHTSLELEIIVSTVTVGRCQKSGHICCTAQLGCCRATSTKFKMLHMHIMNCFGCCANTNFSISTFEPFMFFLKVTQNSCSTHNSPQTNPMAFYNYIQGPSLLYIDM